MRRIPNGNKREYGFSIIEILLVIFIISSTLVSLLGLSSISLRASTRIKETTRANMLAQEAMEAVRNFRDAIPWNNNDPLNQYDGLGVVATDIYHHIAKSGDVPPKWMLLQGEETINGFTRTIGFANVSRDSNKNIVQSGGTPDTNTRKVVVRVSWKNQKVELVNYLTNWKE